MHPVSVTDIVDTATDIQKINMAISLELSALARSAAQGTQAQPMRAQLIVLAAAAELMADRAQIIVETAKQRD